MKTNQINRFILVILVNFLGSIALSLTAHAQVGINTLLPNSSSMLDITSTNKGILIPRMTSIQRLSIVAPATGLMVYETTTNQFFYFDGAIWRPMASNNTAWGLLGNTGTTAGINFIGTTDAKDFVMKTNNTEKMRILSTGNVGIGSLLPNAKLSVARVGGIDDVLTLSDDSSSIVIGTDFDLHGFMRLRPTSGNGFAITNNGDAVGLFVKADATANVGIGTSSPASKLHIVKAGLSGIAPDVNAVMVAENNSTSYINILSPSTSETGVLFGIGGGFTPSANNGSIIYNNASAKKGFQFRTDGNVTKVVIDSLGRVGCGMANPSYRMDIFSALTTDTLIYRGRNNSASGTVTQIGSIEWFKDFSNTIDFNNNSNTAQLAINLNNNATHDLQLAFDDAAKPGTNTWTISSDARLKDDVKNFKDGLETLEQINPVYYQYNGKANTPKGQYFVGVLAQELQKATPYMVGSFEYTPDPKNLDNRETYLSVNNGALTYVMVNSIKELNEKLEKTNAEMENITDFGSQVIPGTEVSVSFLSSFSTKLDGNTMPVVTLSAVNSDARVHVKNVSATGFTIVSSDPGVTVNWIAAGKMNLEKLKISKTYTAQERQDLLEKVQVKKATIRVTEENAEMSKRIKAGEIN